MSVYIIYHSEDHDMAFWQEALERLMPEVRLVAPDAPQALEAEVLMAWNPPDGMIAGFKQLKGVISLAQGVDHILDGKVFPRHVRLARLIDPYMSEAMAEWVVLTVLEYHRDASAYRQAETRREWIRLKPRIAAETHIAVMGLGAIGGAVAEMLTQFKFKVMGWSQSPKTLVGVASHCGVEGFETCIRTADIVVSILPLTESTANLYNAEVFGRMKAGAAFINAGRGKQVVEAALIKALDSGGLSGATLDVMAEEPLPSEHPFWTHPKISVWPHVSAQTNPETANAQIIEAIKAIRAGRPPKNSVNIARGY